jgi:exodeoxyribonuclease VII small subunit
MAEERLSPASQDASASEGPRTYEDLVEELEQLCRRMSSSEVGVEEATRLFERALSIQREARRRLDELTQRVEQLVEAEASEDVGS